MKTNTNALPKRLLGNTGLAVSVVGMGGIPIQRCNQEDAIAMIRTCAEEGINLIDTARGYGASEVLIGKALTLTGLRASFVLATKSPAKDEATMAKDIQTSLDHLETDCIDIYQCHFVKDLDQYKLITGPQGAYQALSKAKANGQIKHIGITAHNKDVLLHAIESGLWETIQFPFNFVETQGLALFERAHQLGIGILVMKPLAGGAIDDAALSLRFITQNPHITLAIPGMDSVDQIQENTAAASDIKPLTEEELIYIDGFKEKMGNRFCRRCGYCGPCPEGIDIPSMFTIEGYLNRYDLTDWAHMRYNSLAKGAKDCVKCGVCEPRCPYDLPIREMLVTVAKAFEGGKKG